MARPDERGRLQPGLPGVIVGFPLLAALALLGLGLPLLWDAREFTRASGVTEGRVTALRSETHCSGTGDDRTCSTVHHPTVRYAQPITGETYELETARPLSARLVTVGERVRLRYRLDAPRVVRLDDWRALWAAPVGLTLAGALALAAFVALRRQSRRTARPAPADAAPPAPVPRWVTAATLAFPALLALVTVGFARDAAAFLHASRPTTGVVLEPATGPDARPLFRYVDHEGAVHEGRPETTPWEAVPAAGVELGLRHRLDDPRVFRVTPHARSLWMPTIVLGVFAALVGAAFVGALRFMATAS